MVRQARLVVIIILFASNICCAQFSIAVAMVDNRVFYFNSKSSSFKKAQPVIVLCRNFNKLLITNEYETEPFDSKGYAHQKPDIDFFEEPDSVVVLQIDQSNCEYPIVLQHDKKLKLFKVELLTSEMIAQLNFNLPNSANNHGVKFIVKTNRGYFDIYDLTTYGSGDDVNREVIVTQKKKVVKQIKIY